MSLRGTVTQPVLSPNTSDHTQEISPVKEKTKEKPKLLRIGSRAKGSKSKFKEDHEARRTRNSAKKVTEALGRKAEGKNKREESVESRKRECQNKGWAKS